MGERPQLGDNSVVLVRQLNGGKGPVTTDSSALQVQPSAIIATALGSKRTYGGAAGTLVRVGLWPSLPALSCR